MFPVLGAFNLLVYCECPCGRPCAIPEGGHYPRCDECGELYVPGGGGPATEDEHAMFGEVDGDGREARRIRGLAYLGLLLPEQKAARLMGLLAVDRFRAADPNRLYYQREQERFIRTRPKEPEEAA